MKGLFQIFLLAAVIIQLNCNFEISNPHNKTSEVSRSAIWRHALYAVVMHIKYFADFNNEGPVYSVAMPVPVVDEDHNLLEVFTLMRKYGFFQFRERTLEDGSVVIVEVNNRNCSWDVYGVFWDSIPKMYQRNLPEQSSKFEDLNTAVINSAFLYIIQCPPANY